MPQKIEMTGLRFGKLTVLSERGRTPAGQVTWLCRCDCGETTIVPGQHLRIGNTKSCGCEQFAGFEPYHTVRHGHAKRMSPTYRVWMGMVQRCTNPKNPDWPLYGARGIRICDRWRLFDNFLTDMGERPAGMMIERKNTNGNYDPGNCCWATATEQARNKRTNKLSAASAAAIRSEYAARHPLHRELAARFGVSRSMISAVLRGERWN